MRQLILACLILFFPTVVYADPLPSWNDRDLKKNIIAFVEKVTDPSSKYYVKPEDRIATFDNDGTLWVEQPLYTQEIFVLERIKVLAAKHPEWKTQKPFSLILSGDKSNLAKITLNDFKKILAVTHSGMSVENYHKIAVDWLAKAKNSHFKHLYKELVYQPMLEVMAYLRANKFKVYIVTGGGQDFVRAFSNEAYHIPREQVIGTIAKTNYVYKDKIAELIKLPSILSIDDHSGKPESINFFIGRKPIIAFGNSDGDRQMLEWTQSSHAQHLMLLVHHDDAIREYAYDTNSKIGTFSNALMAEAQQNKWQIISMKNDWKVIFPFDKN